MYGSVGRLQIKLDHLDALTRIIQKLESTPGVRTMSLVGKDGSPNNYCWTIVWADKAAHDANAARPEFPAAYQQILDALAKEPEWHSGEIV